MSIEYEPRGRTLSKLLVDGHYVVSAPGVVSVEFAVLRTPELLVLCACLKTGDWVFCPFQVSRVAVDGTIGAASQGNSGTGAG
jgi:hypothetical protein